jgi:anti-anti-sigma regulatory factor
MPSWGEAAFAVERTVLGDGSVHVTVSGALHSGISDEFLDVLIEGITPGRTVIVDLASATYFDGTGIAALAVVDRIAELHGSELRVVGCTEEAEHLLTTIKCGLADGAGPRR